jgi:transcriptional regulator with XRE-family HTH domain
MIPGMANTKPEPRPDIAQLRKDAGLTQQQAADQANVGVRVIANAERGHNPRAVNKPKLAELYGVPPESLWPSPPEA